MTEQPDPNPIGYDIGRMQYLERIAETADALEEWLGKNSGESADWPVHIKADEEGAAKLSSLMNDLGDALKPYRRIPPKGVCIVCGGDMLIVFWRGHSDNKKIHCNTCGSEVTVAVHIENQPKP